MEDPAGGQIRIEILPEQRLVWFRGEGRVTYRQLLAKIAEVNAHPAFRPEFDSFVDFGTAEVSHRDGGLEAYREFFDRHQHHATPRRWAIYTTHPETLRNANIAHFLETREITVDVFVTRRDALAWLGRTDPADR